MRTNSQSPWNAFFEGCHSALIDETTERWPEPKPELALPQRHAQFQIPAQGLELLQAVEVHLANKRGTLFMAADSTLPKDLFKNILLRAAREFQFRGVLPSLSKPQPISEKIAQSLPIQRLVWVPVRLSIGRLFLGLGL